MVGFPMQAHDWFISSAPGRAVYCSRAARRRIAAECAFIGDRGGVGIRAETGGGDRTAVSASNFAPPQARPPAAETPSVL
jgi:hypothetical protein